MDSPRPDRLAATGSSASLQAALPCGTPVLPSLRFCFCFPRSFLSRSHPFRRPSDGCTIWTILTNGRTLATTNPTRQKNCEPTRRRGVQLKLKWPFRLTTTGRAQAAPIPRAKPRKQWSASCLLARLLVRRARSSFASPEQQVNVKIRYESDELPRPISFMRKALLSLPVLRTGKFMSPANGKSRRRSSHRIKKQKTQGTDASLPPMPISYETVPHPDMKKRSLPRPC